jgi:trehalose-6-phosphate synthase
MECNPIRASVPLSSVQAPNNSGETEYSKTLQNLSAHVPRTILVDNFDPAIWRTVLRCRDTDIVLIPSLRDTNPLTAMEAKLFCKDMNYVILASKRDGIKDTFEDDQCYWIDPTDHHMFAQTIVLAAETDVTRRQRMISNNLSSLDRFDYSVNFGRFLEGLSIVNPLQEVEVKHESHATNKEVQSRKGC